MNHEHKAMIQDEAGTFAGPLQLSDAGGARRDAMLHELLSAMQSLHRARRMRRRAVAAASFLLLASAAVLLATSLLGPGNAPRPNDRIVEAVPGAAPSTAPEAIDLIPRAPLIARVATAPGILERYRAYPPRIVQRVNDEELLRTLAAIDRPAGLISIGGEVRLTAPVTDDQLR